MAGKSDPAGHAGLRVISISDNQIVVRRGGREVLLSGQGIDRLARSLLPRLEDGHSASEALGTLPEPDRPEAAKVLQKLQTAGLMPVAVGRSRTKPSADLGHTLTLGRDRLRESAVAVLGRTFIARALLRGLLETGVGRVVLVDLPELATPGLPSPPVAGWDAPVAGTGGRLEVLPALPAESELREFSLLCATHDGGLREMLLDANRIALRLGLPFLPVCLAGTIGYLGPLTVPHRSACLRCDLLRGPLPQESSRTPVVSPIAGLLGELTALNVARMLIEPSLDGAAGRLLEVRPVDLNCAATVISRTPGCPDCGGGGVPERTVPRARSRGSRVERAALPT